MKNYQKGMTVADKAIDILRATQDGDNLSERDLKLVECAVNGFLNETAESMFESLYSQVMSGNYMPAHKPETVAYLLNINDDKLMSVDRIIE